MLLAIYWRTVLAFILLIAFCTFGQLGFNVLELAGNTNYYPSFFWSLIAFLFFAAQLINKNGMVYLLWGQRLGLEDAFWRNLNIANILFFIGLALLALIVYATFSSQVWSNFKLLGQPLMLFAIPLIYVRTLLPHVKK